MDYAHVAVWQEKRWLEDPLLIIEVHFSPEQVAFIDQHFWYEEPILSLHDGTFSVRAFIDKPLRQTRTILRVQYETVEICTKDASVAERQIQDFRWKMIKVERNGTAVVISPPLVPHRQGRYRLLK